MRENIKTGDLLAWEVTSVDSPTSALLKIYQKIFSVKFSHVGLAVRIGGRVFVAEATLPYVRLFPLSLKENFYYLGCNIQFQENHIDLLLKDMGKPYSLFDLVKATLNLSFSDKDFYCSEYAADFYKSIGFLTTIDDGITPQKLVDVVSKKIGKEPLYVSIDRGNLNGF